MKAVYIHIPFCKSICSYCDFCKVFYYQKWATQYLRKLREEILDIYDNEEVKSIYIGGGTPSSLSIKEVNYLLEMLNIFNKTPDCEITFECNLEDIQDELLKILKSFGVNRLSLGIQSFDEQNLCLLGRHHTYEEALEKMKKIRAYGFENVNLDLIYAIPTETIKKVKEDVKKFLKLNPDHISTYSLMIEQNTLLWVNGIHPIKEELDEEMYKIICKILKKKGYIHYEVSNFAKKGYESKHNLTYWNNEEYYGFGLSASGYIDQIRYTNTKNLTKYLKGEYKGVEEILSKKDIMDTEIMVGLRKLKGICISEFEEKYQVKLEETYPIKPLLKNGDLEEEKGYIKIPENKIYVMNEILLKMI